MFSTFPLSFFFVIFRPKFRREQNRGKPNIPGQASFGKRRGWGEDEGWKIGGYDIPMNEVDFITKYSKSLMGKFDDFINTYRVRVGQKMFPLKEYMNRKQITRDAIKPLYNELVNRTRYFRSYYSKSLKPTDMTFKLVPMKSHNYSNNVMSQYKNIIRNMYFYELFVNTGTSTENVVPFGIMLNDLYNKAIIDYKILTPSALHYIENGRIGSVFSSYYFRASIMNPFLVYSIQESELRGKRIFSPTLGWSSYCYGFMESSLVTHYVGTDVIPAVCENTRKFAKEQYPDKVCEIFCKPSEKLINDPEFSGKYKGFFDTVFFSPPYYDLEKYSSEQQSIAMYTTYESWLSQYWEPTIKLCKHVLKRGGMMCYIVSNYAGRPTLVSDLEKIVQAQFTAVRMDIMKNKAVYVNNKSDNHEKIFFWRK